MIPGVMLFAMSRLMDGRRAGANLCSRVGLIVMAWIAGACTAATSDHPFSDQQRKSTSAQRILSCDDGSYLVLDGASVRGWLWSKRNPKTENVANVKTLPAPIRWHVSFTARPGSCRQKSGAKDGYWKLLPGENHVEDVPVLQLWVTPYNEASVGRTVTIDNVEVGRPDGYTWTWYESNPSTCTVNPKPIDALFSSLGNEFGQFGDLTGLECWQKEEPKPVAVR